jgi:uncharacterized membrane protein
MSLLRFLSLTALAIWIGGLAVLGLIAAPAIFAALGAHDPATGRELGGMVFGAVFGRFQPVTWVLAGVLLVALGARAALGPRPRRLGLRMWTVALMLAAGLVSSLVVAPRIDAIRASTTGAVADLPENDPKRISFGRLHGLSTALMLGTLVAGLGLMWAEVRDNP